MTKSQFQNTIVNFPQYTYLVLSLKILLGETFLFLNQTKNLSDQIKK